jgi:UDP-glucose 4-epimerase
MAHRQSVSYCPISPQVQAAACPQLAEADAASGPLERGDLGTYADLERAFATHRPWAVMHFAAYAYVGESSAEPAKYYDNNIGGSAKLLQACAAFNCRNFVFSSSCATYGIPERLPITDPPMLVSDSGRARERLGWTPKYPNLDQQIAHAWTWFRDKMPDN